MQSKRGFELPELMMVVREKDKTEKEQGSQEKTYVKSPNGSFNTKTLVQLEPVSEKIELLERENKDKNTYQSLP